MARSGNKPAAILTFLCDALKGGLLAVPLHLGIGDPHVLGGMGIAAVLGHMFPVFNRFRGGKGVATAIGAVAALDWIAGLTFVSVWCVLFLLTRVSAVASLVGLLASGWVLFAVDGTILTPITYGVILLLVLLRHAGNIQRMIAGSENRF